MIKNTLHCLWVAAVVMLGSACTTTPVHTEVDRKAIAERYFGGVYGCQPSVVDELAAEEIVVTYPIFETLFQSATIRGRQAVKEFAARFCSKWAVVFDPNAPDGFNAWSRHKMTKTNGHWTILRSY